MQKNTKSYFGDLILLSVAIMWGFGFIAVKIGLNNGMSPFYLMFLRFSVAALAFLPFQITKIKNISLKTLKRGVILGTFLFFGFAFQTVGLYYTTTSKNAFLTGVNVIIVPFLTWWLTKKKVDIYSIIAAFMCLIGIGLLTLHDSLNINIGDLLTLICAIMFAAHISITSIIANEEASGTLVWIQMMVGGVLSFIFAMLFNETLVISLSSSIAILYLGLFSTFLAFFLQTVGQKYAHAAKAAILLSTESLFGALLAVIFFKDAFALNMLLGCILIFASIIVSETKLSFMIRKA
ncbi:MAG: EamA family transporter [Firmicutes bacterium HGW-Firmicutes-7]|nr:MAG: EamA family transporter [Firmicutes bacterium HGW-Firmicutes-7]